MSKKVLISGGSGMIGTELARTLTEKDYEVALLSRNPESNTNGYKAYKWDIKSGYIDPDAFENTNYVVHLAGADVAEKRWTEKRKEEIVKSRTASAHVLYKWLKENPHAVEAFISSSGISYYGLDAAPKPLVEESRPGNDFLAEVTKAWEKSADKVGTLDIRVVKFRIGIVLSNKGGALVELAKPVKLGAAAPLGSGDQIMSWIHIQDLCNMLVFALENPRLEGVFNAVAPHPVSNSYFTKETAKILKKPAFLPPVPAVLLKLILGERASIILDGMHVSSQKIEEEGFNFTYPNLIPALKNLL